jgi:plasmid stabilization system protein ParE
MDVAFQRIADSPALSPLCDDRHRFYTLRRYPYIVVYRVEASGDVIVVAVAHARRSASYWQSRS